jgi:hypothetical protein
MSRWFFTTFPRADVPHGGVRVERDRDGLRDEIQNARPWSGAKTDLAMICPATFRGDYRKNDNVEGVWQLGVDIDAPQSDPQAVARAITTALGGVEGFFFSTFSSEADALRLRGFIPYETPASAAEHRASWALVARVLDRAGITIDRSCSDPSRGYFMWAIPPNGIYWSTHVPGVPWPVSAAAAVEHERLEAERTQRLREARTAARCATTTERVARARAYLAKCEPAISGAGGHRATFVVALKLVQGFMLGEKEALALLLADYNQRCVPPWSERDLARKVKEAAERGREFVRGSLLRSPRRKA